MCSPDVTSRFASIASRALFPWRWSQPWGARTFKEVKAPFRQAAGMLKEAITFHRGYSLLHLKLWYFLRYLRNRQQGPLRQTLRRSLQIE